jgi:hypothetical protein
MKGLDEDVGPFRHSGGRKLKQYQASVSVPWPGLRKGWLLWREGRADPLGALNVRGELPPAAIHAGNDPVLFALGQLHGVTSGYVPADRLEPFFLTPLGLPQATQAHSTSLAVFLATSEAHRPGLHSDALAGTLAGRLSGRPGKRRNAPRRTSSGAGLQEGSGPSRCNPTCSV